MQRIDAYSIQEIGIPGMVLMEKAAMSMEEEILSRFGEKTSFLIVTEKGNNEEIRDKVVLVGLHSPVLGRDESSDDESMDELSALVELVAFDA